MPVSGSTLGTKQPVRGTKIQTDWRKGPGMLINTRDLATSTAKWQLLDLPYKALSIWQARCLEEGSPLDEDTGQV